MRHVIAIDFDGTLCDHEFPNIGKPKWDIINAAKEAQVNGNAIILWTCRDGELLNRAVAWCKDKGLIFDAINENLSEVIEAFDLDTRKVIASEYWDDKAKHFGSMDKRFKA